MIKSITETIFDFNIFQLPFFLYIFLIQHFRYTIKETKTATMNIFLEKKTLLKSFVKIELSYVFAINLFTKAKNCMEK